ncbi:hypothetical protein ACHAW6_001131, partial [Cyclotella cf. meneghiniana]
LHSSPYLTDLFREIPYGIKTTNGNTKDYVLQRLANIYGQKQAGRVHNQYLVRKLESIGFTQSQIYECISYRDTVIFIIYVDDGIFLGSFDDQQSHILRELSDLGLKLRIKDIQPTMLESTSAVGKLNYLGNTSRSDILYATHRIAKYSSNPRQENSQAIIYIIRYLIKTWDLGLHFKPDPSKGFYCYADVDFSGEWNKDFAKLDPSTAKSRIGWFTLYATWPVIRDLRGIYCKAFEDNSGVLELAKLPKLVKEQNT